MVRRRFHPLIAFAAVIAAAGSVTAAGLTFTAHTVSKTVAELPEVKKRVLPSYVVRLPEAKPADLDIAKSVPVRPAVKMPVTVPDMPVAQAAVATEPPAAELAAPQEPTLVAEVTPLEQESDSGPVYVVSSDVFVRSGPSKSYDRLGTVTRGTEVRVDGEDGGWLKVSFAGGSGWVYQRYLTPARGEQVAERAPF